MNKFEKIISQIKSLEIQGAESVAYSSIEAIEYIIQKSKAITTSSFLKELNNAKKELIKTRPTEPCMKNTLNFVLEHDKLKDLNDIKAQITSNIKKAKKHINEVENKISRIGARLIKNGSVVFTHCHSTTVMKILKSAKDQGKKFEVHNTEARPNMQGRISAKELSDYGIPVTHFVDSAARIALKHSDLVLLGCDAITTTKVINKIGSEMFAEIANNLDIPVYICTDSWKFDSHSIFGFDETIEARNKREVWNKAPKKVRICNPIFEKIHLNLIDGIISEMGLYGPRIFLEEVRRTYPYLFKR